jgi:hypothetical protein
MWGTMAAMASRSRKKMPATLDELKLTTIKARFTHPEAGDRFKSLGGDCRYFAAFAGSHKNERKGTRRATQTMNRE